MLPLQPMGGIIDFGTIRHLPRNFREKVFGSRYFKQNAGLLTHAYVSILADTKKRNSPDFSEFLSITLRYYIAAFLPGMDAMQ